MSISDTRRRDVVVGLLSVGAIVGGVVSPGVAGADCIEPDGKVKSAYCTAADSAAAQSGLGSSAASGVPAHSAPPIADMRPSPMRAFCAISACFLITSRPQAGIGGKT
jgi:hypothetical protein